MNLDRIVAKSGGSSVADATQIRKTVDIFLENEQIEVLVVSAPKGITDKLYNIHYKNQGILTHCKESNYTFLKETKEELFNQVIETYKQIGTELGIGTEIAEEYRRTLSETLVNPNHTLNDVIKTGEEYNAKTIAKFAGVQYIDAAKAIHIDKNGNPDNPITQAWMTDIVEKYSGKKVTGGFYANTSTDRENPVIGILGRNGSDVSGAIWAAMLHATYYNFTDTDGIKVIDPRVLSKESQANIPTINGINYIKSEELTWFGAKVLNYQTIEPLRKRNIITYVKNTNNPKHPGTKISIDAKMPKEIIGIAGKKNISRITLYKNRLIEYTGSELKLPSKIVDFMISKNVEYDIFTGTNTIELTINNEAIELYETKIREMIKRSIKQDAEIEKNLAIIAIIGTPNIVTRHKLSETLKEIGIKPDTIEKEDIVLTLQEKDYEKTMIALYDRFLQPRNIK